MLFSFLHFHFHRRDAHLSLLLLLKLRVQCSFLDLNFFSISSIREEMQTSYLHSLCCCCITRMILLLLFCFIPSLLSTTPHPHLNNASDQHALLRFISAITYDPSQQQLAANWTPHVSFCHWTGILCSRRRQRVVSLNVSRMGLQGTISPFLANLSFLSILDLANNSFQGQIPYQLGSLFRLKLLTLSWNQLQGSIPPTLVGYRSLRTLSLSSNNLTGNIPVQLCLLPKLRFIYLGRNNLTGTIPACLGNIFSLQEINLDHNKLDGSVPSELGMLSQVSIINLNHNYLTGQFPSSLSNCTNLQILDLNRNQLTGHIPAELCNKNTQLEELILGVNQLSGSIPASLFNCTNLQYLNLWSNHLTRNIPVQLCLLPKLRIIYLGRNNLSGTISSCLGNISSLQDIDLSENNLHGTVPSQLSMLSQVSVIYLASNYLTGQFPSSLSNCTNLLKLDLNSNQLTGHIPMELCSKNTRLEELYLGGNQLSGSIPASLFNCTNFRTLDLPVNHLSGLVPMQLGKLTQLEWLGLEDNQLISGSTTTLPIITTLTNCSALEVLDLSANRLSGHLPLSLGRLSTKLYSLNLRFNDFTGEIPPHIVNLTGLTFLALSNNVFIGTIPPSLNMLSKLERLYMGGNNLQGKIPMEIGKLKGLGVLDLSQNNLSGKIPDSLAHLQQLRYLYLNQNHLSGNIPANLGKCVNLLLLDLSYNRLTGRIPPEVAGLANLAFYFNLSNNLLHGPMPLEISKMTMLIAIDLSANQFIGYIPSALQSCKEVEYLNLSCNRLEGPIPDSLSELQSLEDLDFSSNNLSGGIPMSLQNLKMLKHLNFSFNKLLGEVPKGGVFKKLGATSFMGNLGLCGPWVSLSPCFVGKHKSVAHLKRVIIVVIAITATIVVACLILGILWRQNHKKHSSSEASLNVGYRRISYGELISATDEFNEANVLGVGSFGKVYKGVLNDGTIVAIKLLNVENERAQKSFHRECKVLSRVRHRNLIRIITSYSDLQVKALIFPLMPNGSLGKWLYPDGEEQSNLSLIQRLNIAIDIAEGLVYLHHHCFVQVIHCDLKPNNVLLGEDMTAYLIDFGIATICFEDSKDFSFTSTHALKGSTGYIAPEYGLSGHVTTKGDVYSYGIVLLEMLTGKKPTNNMFVEGMNLPKWVGSALPNQIVEVVDMSLLRIMSSTSIEEDKDFNCLRELRTLGLLCTHESPEARPTMIDIVSALQHMRKTFLGVVDIPKFQSDITHLLASSSTTHNNIAEAQSSSTS